MRESNSVHCQTEDNTESKCNTKTTLRLTCNNKINEYNTYNKSNILEEDKSINQSFTNDNNHAEVETAGAYKTI